MASILIIFGSTGGNTELVTDKVNEVLNDVGHKVTIQRAEESSIEDVKKAKNLIFASSTYGQGLLQDHMLKFFKEVKGLDMKGKKCAVIGLGDNKYNTEYVIEAARILETGLKELGAEILLPPLRINKTPVPNLNATILKWAKDLSTKFK